MRSRLSRTVLFFFLAGFVWADGQPLPVVSGCEGPAAKSLWNFQVTVYGSGFPQGATVRWNSTPLTTSQADSGRVTASLPPTPANIAVLTLVSNGVLSNCVLVNRRRPRHLQRYPQRCRGGGIGSGPYRARRGFYGGFDCEWPVFRCPPHLSARMSFTPSCRRPAGVTREDTISLS